VLYSTPRRRRSIGTLLAALAVALAPLSIAPPSTAAESAYVVFSSNRAEDRFNLFRMNIDGSGLTQLTSGGPNATRPAISPDGTKIAYSSGVSLRVMNSDGSGVETLASTYTWVGSVDWSPDGSKLVYTESGGGSGVWKLHVMNADGTDDQVILSAPILRTVTFAPDGNILYGTATNAGVYGRPQLWVTSPDGDDRRLLRESGFDDFALAPNGRGVVLTENVWDGSKILGGLFYWDDIANLSIPNYPATTTLWAGTGFVSSPSIGADGRVLHAHDPDYFLFLDTPDDITIVNADGTGRTKLTTGGSEDVDPDWFTGTPPPPAAPTVTITDGPTGTITQTRPTFSFSSNQTSTFECRLYDRSTPTIPNYQRCSDPWVSDGTFRPDSALTHGAWTFSVRAVGQAGQRSQVATRNFNVDTGDGADLTMLDTLAFGDVPYLTEVTKSVTVSNTGSQTYDGFLEIEGSGRYDYSITSSTCGSVRVTIPGNTSCSISITFKPRFINQRSATLVFEPNLPGVPYHRIDLTGKGTSEAPSAPEIVDFEEYTASKRPSFEYEATDTDTLGYQFECRIYPIGQIPPNFEWCSVPQGPFHTSPVDLVDGEYTFEVRSVDQGNPTPESDVAAVDFTVDTVAPTVTIDDAPTVTADPRPVFTFSSNEPVTFWCRFDPDEGSVFMPCSGPDAMHRPADGLTNGEHVFEVRATDRAGNRSVASTSFTINADVPLPPTDLAGTPVTATSAQVTFTPPADTAGAMSYEVTCESSDGGAPASATTASSSVTLDGLTNGSLYTCVATATNAAGTSVPSDPTPEFLQAVAPTAPNTVAASLWGPGEAQVSFVPGDDGGAPVDVFDVQCVAEDGRPTRSGQGAGSPITVTGLDAGATYGCIVRATNAVGDSPWSDPADVLRVPGDPDPTASITGPSTVDEGDTISLSAASSTGVGPLTFAWDTDGDGDYDDGTGPAATVAAARHGTITVGLRVTDANDESVTTSHTVTIANVAPQLAPIADQEVTEGDALSATGSFTDPGDNTWTATVDFGSGRQPLTLTGRTFTVTHPSPVDGTVVVRVCDDADACDEETFTVDVTEAPPALTAVIEGPATTDEGTDAVFSAANSTGSGPLTFAWDTDGDGEYDDGTGPSVTVPASTHGSITIGLRVTDAGGDRTTTTHRLTVRNVAPVLDSIPDQLIAHDGELAVAGSFVDPGANTWTATIDDGSGPRPLTLTGKGFSIVDTDPVSGTVTVRVCDDAGACDETSFEVEVMAAPAPVAVISGPTTVTEGSSADFSARDSSGDGTLSFAWDLDGDGDYDDSTAEDVTIDFPTAGTRTLGLQVTDSVGGTTVLRTITVTAVSPTVADIDDQQVDRGEEFTVTGWFSDPGDNTWTATVDFGDGPQPLELDGHEFTLTRAFERAGAHEVRVQVCDDHQACGATTFTVNVGGTASGGGVTIPGLGTLPRTGATLGVTGLGLALLLTVTGWLLVRRRARSS